MIKAPTMIDKATLFREIKLATFLIIPERSFWKQFPPRCACGKLSEVQDCYRILQDGSKKPPEKIRNLKVSNNF